ncbi:MAG: oxidoreductase [Chloroflexi bacterium]|nr:MAG: oxidoreductase [Chloroflexota bacterium]
MGKVVRFAGPYQVEVADYPERELAVGEVRLATLYSGISSGTELTHYRGTNPYAHKQYDAANRLFRVAEPSRRYPRSSGYEEVGEVVEIGPGVEGVSLGDLVYGGWQHHSTHIMDGELARRQKLLPGLEPLQGIFSQIGKVALNGILDAQINLGEVVAIFGQGTPGLIATQLARLSGATVIAVDLFSRRLELAAELGADYVIDPQQTDPAEEIKRLTGSRGADVCLEVSGSSFALQAAIRSVAYSGRVVALGFFQGEARGLYLGEEFHHNRVQVICSQAGGVNQAYSYRWDASRLEKTIMTLQEQGRLRLREVISEIYPFEQASRAYERLDKDPADVIQLVLDFRHAAR